MRTISVAIRRSCAISALALIAQFSPRAHAALGEDVSAIANDQARLQASLQVRQNVRQNLHFAVHELSSPIGIKIREFVAESGRVFAVSWSGGWRPNLRDIMGEHYDRFIAGTRGRRMARGPVRIDLPGMVVVMGGHQRAFFGHVYLTALVPADLALEDLQ
jgi:hypothetical protein